MTYFGDKWGLVRNFPTNNALVLKNSTFKEYLYYSNPVISLGEDEARASFIYAMNTNKDETSFELLFSFDRALDGSYSNKWNPVPAEVLERLFKARNGYWNFCNITTDTHFMENEWMDNTNIEIVDGHFLFKYDTRWLKNKLGSISKKSIHYSMPGRLVYENDDNIAIAARYFPKMKYTLYDTIAILSALRTISNVSFSMATDEDGMTCRKKSLLERLKKTSSDLAEYEKNYQEILDKAADAMNIMSSKYGIEIDV